MKPTNLMLFTVCFVAKVQRSTAHAAPKYAKSHVVYFPLSVQINMGTLSSEWLASKKLAAKQVRSTLHTGHVVLLCVLRFLC